MGVPTCQRRGEPLRYEGVGACPFWPHARPGSRNATPMTRRPTHKPDTARARASPLFPAHVPPFIHLCTARAIRAPLAAPAAAAPCRRAAHGMRLCETSNPRPGPAGDGRSPPPPWLGSGMAYDVSRERRTAHALHVRSACLSMEEEDVWGSPLFVPQQKSGRGVKEVQRRPRTSLARPSKSLSPPSSKGVSNNLPYS